jgi:hypothetical protein
MNPITFGGKRLGSVRDTTFVNDSYVHGVRRIIGYALSVNVNQTNTDVPITLLLNPGANAVVRDLMVNNASTSLTNATAGLFTAAAGGGTAIVSNAALSALTTATTNLEMTIATTAFIVNQTTQFSTTLAASVLYLRIGTAQGSAATADFYIWGDVIP